MAYKEVSCPLLTPHFSFFSIKETGILQQYSDPLCKTDGISKIYPFSFLDNARRMYIFVNVFETSRCFLCLRKKCFFLSLFFGGKGTHLVMLNDYSWIFTQEILMVEFREPYGMPGMERMLAVCNTTTSDAILSLVYQ